MHNPAAARLRALVTLIPAIATCGLMVNAAIAQTYPLRDIIHPDTSGLPEQDDPDGPRFGMAVAADGDRILIGAPKLIVDSGGLNPVQTGARALYRRQGDQWLPEGWRIGQVLGDEDGDQRGRAVAVASEGNREFELAGAPYSSSGQPGRGSVTASCHSGCAGGYMFYGQAGDQLGYAVAVSTDEQGFSRAVLGAPGGNYAQIIVRSPGEKVWTLEATLAPSNGDAGDRFGHSVAIAQNGGYPSWVAIGAPQHGFLAGAVYVFRRNHITNVWSQVALVYAPSPQAGDLFGAAVAWYDSGLNNMDHLLAVGAPNRYPNGDTNADYRRGTVSLFRQGANPGDLSHDGDASFNTFTCVSTSICDGKDQAMSLGSTLAFDGQDLWIGAPTYDEGGYSNVGRVYRARLGSIFGNEGWWIREALSPGSPAEDGACPVQDPNMMGRADGRFGSALAVFNGGLAVGHPGRGCTMDVPPYTVPPRSGEVRVYAIPKLLFRNGFEDAS